MSKFFDWFKPKPVKMSMKRAFQEASKKPCDLKLMDFDSEEFVKAKEDFAKKYGIVEQKNTEKLKCR